MHVGSHHPSMIMEVLVKSIAIPMSFYFHESNGRSLRRYSRVAPMWIEWPLIHGRPATEAGFNTQVVKVFLVNGVNTP